MRLLSVVRSLLIVALISPSATFAQSASSASVPRLIRISGVFRPANGQPAGAVETVTLSIYADQEGGAPLWQETQTIAIDGQGRYSVLLGAASPDGIPGAVFGSEAAHWLGTVFERVGEVEGPRTRLTSVPYAIRAADADTLGGRPATDYVLTPAAARDSGSPGAATVDATPAVSVNDVQPGTTNLLAKYLAGGADVGNSAVYEANGQVGINTTTPFDTLHVRFNNSNGAFTGYAVQNTALSPTAYSGTLFFDQDGTLGQFQGFNNSTHEYRINNIARVTPGGAFNGSINFMVGSTSRFFVGSNGNIGIATTTPAFSLEVSNALSGFANVAVGATSYNNSNLGSIFGGRKARGTAAAPTAVLSGDNLVFINGRGYGATNFGTGGASIVMRTTENWSDTAQGALMQFQTAANTTNVLTPRMTINHNGNVGIGTTVPSEALEVVREGQQGAQFLATTFGAEQTNGGGGFMIRNARGTAAAPTAVQLGDSLGYFVGGGYGTSGFGNEFAGGSIVIAAENWSDAAQGAAVVLAATPLGSNEAQVNLAVLPGGNVGIGQFDDFPVITDRLQVFGDIRVGTTGTNGCLRNFAGTGIAGTCASDRRFKKEVTPFGHVLDQLTALQPVHYYWRAEDFPSRNFGNSRTYGLIAQDVEQVLPELVATDGDGYKAVDYSQLPLLTIQGVKELKSKVEDLNGENVNLKQRVAELERLVAELLAATRR